MISLVLVFIDPVLERICVPIEQYSLEGGEYDDATPLLLSSSTATQDASAAGGSAAPAAVAAGMASAARGLLAAAMAATAESPGGPFAPAGGGTEAHEPAQSSHSSHATTHDKHPCPEGSVHLFSKQVIVARWVVAILVRWGELLEGALGKYLPFLAKYSTFPLYLSQG